ncbi:MAG TPA: FUSC family protein, partial [Thermomicrobiales bacterium]|nr:FUSC family protein [Thermomicrobiales bacterium]
MTQATPTFPEHPRLFQDRTTRGAGRQDGLRESEPSGPFRQLQNALIASDPGLNRLIAAVQVVASMGAAIWAAWFFIHRTKVMWIEPPHGVTLPAAQLAALSAQHHGITLLAMMMAGIIGLMASSAVMDPTPGGQILTMISMPIPMIATMAISIEMASHRTPGIILMALVLGLGTYLRKFVPVIGPRAALYGMVLFNGYLTGFLSAGSLKTDQLGWIAVILWIGIFVSMVLKFIVFKPLDRGRFRRMTGSFLARSHDVISSAIALIDAKDERDRERAHRRLRQRLTRLNETALVIDASLTTPGALPAGVTAYDAHEELFDIELMVQNVGSIVQQLADANLPGPLRAEIREWLVNLQERRSDLAVTSARAVTNGATTIAGVSENDMTRVRRLAAAVEEWATVAAAWPSRSRELEERDRVEPFASRVNLILGNLPGSALVSRQATVTQPGFPGHLAARLHLDAPAQIAIRVAVAVGVASWLGTLLNEQRFYWAVIAVFVIFLGTNTAAEQATKAVYRVIGTMIGIFAGSLLAHAIGLSVWSIAVILVAVGIGMYFAPINYAVMTFAVTISVSQLYEQLGEFSFHLLEIRVEETAIGAAIATLAALVIFPVNTRRAATIAAHGSVAALGTLLEQAVAKVRGHADGSLTGAARAVDAASQQLLTTARPLLLNPFRRDRLEYNLGLFGHAAHQARNLAADIERHGRFDPATEPDVVHALEQERKSVLALQPVLDGQRDVAPPRRLDLDYQSAHDRSRSRGDDAACRMLTEL